MILKMFYTIEAAVLFLTKYKVFIAIILKRDYQTYTFPLMISVQPSISQNSS